MWTRKAALSGIACAAVGAPAAACVMRPIEPPPTYWVEALGDTDGDGGINTLIAQEVTLFLTTADTNCSCGIGFNGLPLSAINLEGVKVQIWDKVLGTRRDFEPFNALQRNEAADNAYNQAREGTGETWFGFGGLIETVGAPPMLGQNEVIKIVFEVDTRLPWSGDVVIGSGEGLSDNLPNFDPTNPHAVTFFSPLDSFIEVVPAPGVLAAMGMGMLLINGRQRARATY